MGSASTTDTLAALQLAVERRHDRDAVLRRWTGDRWEPMPDWRFHRHVMRIALYLRERAGVKEGDRVALLAPLSPEWLIADWATVIQGATTVVADPDMSKEALAAAWTRLTPRVALVASQAALARLLEATGGPGSLESVIALEPIDAGAGGPRIITYSEALDLGGTLDTAERANAMRARAREVQPSTPAIAHAASRDVMSHGDAVGRIRLRWSTSPAGKGNVANAEWGVPAPPAHVALYGCVADGSSCVSFGGNHE